MNFPISSSVPVRDNLTLGAYLVLIPGNLSLKSVSVLPQWVLSKDWRLWPNIYIKYGLPKFINTCFKIILSVSLFTVPDPFCTLSQLTFLGTDIWKCILLSVIHSTWLIFITHSKLLGWRSWPWVTKHWIYKMRRKKYAVLKSIRAHFAVCLISYMWSSATVFIKSN